MMAELMVLGGAEEIGANCTYLDLDGTGFLIDAGLHPRDRGMGALPDIDALEHRQADVLAITHAHNDHLGGLPYVMRRMPYLRPIMSHATRDLSHVMLHNTAKLLKTDVTSWFPAEALDFYRRDTIEQLRHTFEALPYGEPMTIRGRQGRSDVTVTLHWAGHILGSASVHLACNGLSILHTGDLNTDHQAFIQRSRIPRTHVDVLITEATNAGTDRPHDFQAEGKRLASFINRVTTANGSVLIPGFALGKTQEILRTIHGLMRRGSIPSVPIFTAGMGVRINKVYDQYCYTEPVRQPGFEISDIPQRRIRFDELFHGDYMKTPSIVIAPSGMMNRGTISHALGIAWSTRPSFGIAFIGYQDPTSPGYAMLTSVPGTPFDFGGRSIRRSCMVERFRFSAHASLEGLTELVTDIKPKTVVIVHGERDACDHLALIAHERLPGTRVLIPRHGRAYRVGAGRDTADMLSQDDEG